MGGAGGSYWAICWLFYVQVLFIRQIRHSGPRLYPLIKSVGHQTSFMSCPSTYDAHENIRWSKRGGASCGFASRTALAAYSLQLAAYSGDRGSRGLGVLVLESGIWLLAAGPLACGVWRTDTSMSCSWRPAGGWWIVLYCIRARGNGHPPRHSKTKIQTQPSSPGLPLAASR
jgi:hypothetical protein